MNTVPITVWIHGTLPEHLFPLLDHVHIESIHRFFYCKPGLHLASSYDPKYHHYDIATTLADKDPTHFPFDSFYIYGWSGKLDPAERLQAAHQLMHALKTVRDQYAQQQVALEFRVITHSHGGNVALNLSNINNDSEIAIKELILLAVPVQEATERFIENESLFNRIYSLHSHWDFLQVADPQGWAEVKNSLKNIFKIHNTQVLQDALHTMQEKTFFSKRHFDTRATVVQANIQYPHRNLLHIEFLMLPFIGQLPGMLAQLRNATPSDTDIELFLTE